MSNKKSKSTILRGIIDSLASSDEAKTIYQIAKDLDSNWDTIKNNIELLEDLGVVSREDGDVYLEKRLELDEDAIAGLPISADTKRRTYALSYKVYEKWQEMTGDKPNKTQLQKAVVEIAGQISELDIPQGWYLYGKIVPVNIQPDKFTEKIRSESLEVEEETLNEVIADTISNISHLSYSQLLNYQYNKYEKEDYQTKLEITRLIACDQFDQDKFRNLIYKLMFEFPLQEDDDFSQKTLSLLKEAGSIIIEKSSQLELKDALHKQILEDMFKSFWGIYATHALYVSIKDDLEGDKRLVRRILDDRVESFAQNLDEIFDFFV